MRVLPILALLLTATACGPKLDQRLLSDDDATRLAAIDQVKGLSEDKRADLVPLLMTKLDTTRVVRAPDNKEDLGPALTTQVQNTLEGQEVRRRALAGLTAVGAPAVTPLAGVVADTHQRPWVRADVAKALGDIGESAKSAEPALEGAFAATKDERLKATSAGALVLLGRRDEEYVDALNQCAAHCDAELRPYAASILAKVAP